jgi:hypothetical protein
MRLTEATMLCEDVPDKENWDIIRKIYAQVDDEIKVSLPTLELMFTIQMRKGAELNKDIEVNHKVYKIFQLYEKLDLINQVLVKIMMGIAKKYSLEIPLQAIGQSGQTVRIG